MGIYKRGKNYYIDFYSKEDRIREKTGPSLKTARKVLKKRQVEVIENRFLDVRKEARPIKFHDFAVEYVAWSKTNKKASSRGRQLSLMRQLDNEFGGKPLHKIISLVIERYKARRKEKIKRPGAVLDGQDPENWFVEYKRPKGKKVRKFFGSDQLAARAFLTASNQSIAPATVNREWRSLNTCLPRRSSGEG